MTEDKDKKKKEEFSKAFKYAQKLLAVRLRSEEELRKRINIKFKNKEVTELVIQELKEHNLVDDREFALEFTQSKVASLWHPRLIMVELMKRGVKKEIAKEVTSLVDMDDLKRRVRERMSALELRNKHLPVEKRKRRIISYFLRRGFPLDFLQDLLSDE